MKLTAEHSTHAVMSDGTFVAFRSPHPGPLPSGEGERHSASLTSGAFVVTQRWLTFSLSRRERAGVRGAARQPQENFRSTNTLHISAF